MRRVILHGWEKARGYGFTAECCVRSYIEFMCLLGGGFDRDVLLPWAAEILNEKCCSDQVARGDRLYYRMWEYIDHIARDYRNDNGQPTTARFMEDLKRLRHNDTRLLSPATMPGFIRSVEDNLRRLFPAKYAYVGEDRVRVAITLAIDCAKTYGITSERGATLFTSMRFVLGAGFNQDLLIPWAEAALKDPAIPDQHIRIDKLYSEGVGFLRRWWDLSSASGDLRNVLG